MPVDQVVQNTAARLQPHLKWDSLHIEILRGPESGVQEAVSQTDSPFVPLFCSALAGFRPLNCRPATPI
jgi:hypothetical protein